MAIKNINEFQGYVKASLESIKLDLQEIKNQQPRCMLRFENLEKEQSKLKGIYLGIAGIIGAIAGIVSRWFK